MRESQRHLKVGDTIHVVCPQWRSSTKIEPGTVTKVARKYLTVSFGESWEREFQFELDTGLEKRDEYTSNRMFLIASREAYEENQRMQKLWHKFHRSIEKQYSAPVGMTRERIRQLAQMFNVELEEKEED